MTIELKLFELANPSDPYTFYAPSIEVAGAVAVMLSSAFGAIPVNDEEGERTPVLFGWDEWLEEKGINSDWIDDNRLILADAFDSFMIGDAARRADIDSMLALLPDDKKQQWKDERQERRRSSMNQIGERAYLYAERLRRLESDGTAEK